MLKSPQSTQHKCVLHRKCPVNVNLNFSCPYPLVMLGAREYVDFHFLKKPLIQMISPGVPPLVNAPLGRAPHHSFSCARPWGALKVNTAIFQGPSEAEVTECG